MLPGPTVSPRLLSSCTRLAADSETFDQLLAVDVEDENSTRDPDRLNGIRDAARRTTPPSFLPPCGAAWARAQGFASPSDRRADYRARACRGPNRCTCNRGGAACTWTSLSEAHIRQKPDCPGYRPVAGVAPQSS